MVAVWFGDSAYSEDAEEGGGGEELGDGGEGEEEEGPADPFEWFEVGDFVVGVVLLLGL